MPDLFIFSRDNEVSLRLHQIAQEKGFRVKYTSQYNTALQWLKLRRFDMAFIDGELTIKDQQELAGILWERNLSALLYVFEFREISQPTSEIRLYGAELAQGANALLTLERALESFEEAAVVPASELRILVVEDLDSPRDIICIFLEGLGYSQVTGMRSATEALAALQEDPIRFSCIVTDLRMPVMSGAELIQAVRSDGKLKHLPIIVLTAFGTADSLLECLRLGASGFMVKPPKRSNMEQELGRALRIASGRLDPRLIGEEDVEGLRAVLERKGFL